MSNQSGPNQYVDLLVSTSEETNDLPDSLQEEIKSVSELLVKIMDSSVGFGGDTDQSDGRGLRFHEASELEKLLETHPEWRMVFAKLSFIKGGIVLYEDEKQI